MKIQRINWFRRFFYNNDSEKWKIKIIIHASEDEVQKLREMESESILKKILDL